MAPPSALKQAIRDSGVPITDHQLLAGFGLAMGVGHAVFDVEALHTKTVKRLSDRWMIIDRHHHLARAGAHVFCQLDVVRLWKVNAVALSFPVRRIAIEEGVRPVVLAHALLPLQILHIRAGQPQVGRA